MDDQKSRELCGKPLSEVQKAIDNMEIRAKYIHEHQRRTRYIFDELWPGAKDLHTWQCVKSEVEKVIEFIRENPRHFPNREEHIEQWEALREVASCCHCMCQKECRFTVCPNRQKTT